jgi:hypothetical protein
VVVDITQFSDGLADGLKLAAYDKCWYCARLYTKQIYLIKQNVFVTIFNNC